MAEEIGAGKVTRLRRRLSSADVSEETKSPATPKKRGRPPGKTSLKDIDENAITPTRTRRNTAKSTEVSPVEEKKRVPARRASRLLSNTEETPDTPKTPLRRTARAKSNLETTPKRATPARRGSRLKSNTDDPIEAKATTPSMWTDITETDVYDSPRALRAAKRMFLAEGAAKSTPKKNTKRDEQKSPLTPATEAETVIKPKSLLHETIVEEPSVISSTTDDKPDNQLDETMIEEPPLISSTIKNYSEEEQATSGKADLDKTITNEVKDSPNEIKSPRENEKKNVDHNSTREIVERTPIFEDSDSNETLINLIPNLSDRINKMAGLNKSYSVMNEADSTSKKKRTKSLTNLNSSGINVDILNKILSPVKIKSVGSPKNEIKNIVIKDNIKTLVAQEDNIMAIDSLKETIFMENSDDQCVPVVHEDKVAIGSTPIHKDECEPMDEDKTLPDKQSPLVNRTLNFSGVKSLSNYNTKHNLKTTNKKRKTAQNVTDSSEDDSEDEDSEDDERTKSDNCFSFLDNQADDAGIDYESGDSQDEEEREYERANEIVERGESLRSEGDDLSSDDSDYEKDSFVVSSNDEEHSVPSSSEDVDFSDDALTMSAQSKRKYNECKEKERKKASREFYEARHSLNSSESKKKNQDNDSLDEELVLCRQRKRNRQRINSTLDDTVEEEPKKPMRSNRFRLNSSQDSESDENNSDIGNNTLLEPMNCSEKEIRNIILGDDNSNEKDPLNCSMTIKKEVATPSKSGPDTSFLKIEMKGADGDVTMHSLEQSVNDPLEISGELSSEEERIEENYDKLLNELHKVQKKEEIIQSPVKKKSFTEIVNSQIDNSSDPVETAIKESDALNLFKKLHDKEIDSTRGEKKVKRKSLQKQNEVMYISSSESEMNKSKNKNKSVCEREETEEEPMNQSQRERQSKKKKKHNISTSEPAQSGDESEMNKSKNKNKSVCEETEEEPMNQSQRERQSKKKKKHNISTSEPAQSGDASESEMNKSKNKNKSVCEWEETEEEPMNQSQRERHSKKKKKHNISTSEPAQSGDDLANVSNMSQKKKSQKSSICEPSESMEDLANVSNMSQKKKSQKSSICEPSESIEDLANVSNMSQKKKSQKSSICEPSESMKDLANVSNMSQKKKSQKSSICEPSESMEDLANVSNMSQKTKSQKSSICEPSESMEDLANVSNMSQKKKSQKSSICEPSESMEDLANVSNMSQKKKSQKSSICEPSESMEDLANVSNMSQKKKSQKSSICEPSESMEDLANVSNMSQKKKSQKSSICEPSESMEDLANVSNMSQKKKSQKSSICEPSESMEDLANVSNMSQKKKSQKSSICEPSESMKDLANVSNMSQKKKSQKSSICEPSESMEDLANVSNMSQKKKSQKSSICEPSESMKDLANVSNMSQKRISQKSSICEALVDVNVSQTSAKIKPSKNNNMEKVEDFKEDETNNSTIEKNRLKRKRKNQDGHDIHNPDDGKDKMEIELHREKDHNDAQNPNSEKINSDATEKRRKRKRKNKDHNATQNSDSVVTDETKCDGTEKKRRKRKRKNKDQTLTQNSDSIGTDEAKLDGTEKKHNREPKYKNCKGTQNSDPDEAKTDGMEVKEKKKRRKRKRNKKDHNDTQNSTFDAHKSIAEQTQAKRRRMNENGQDDATQAGEKIQKSKVVVRKLPTDILNSLPTKKPKVVSTVKFTVQKDFNFRKTPSQYLENSVIIGAETPPKPAVKRFIPKVLPAVSTAKVSYDGFTTLFQTEVLKGNSNVLGRNDKTNFKYKSLKKSQTVPSVALIKKKSRLAKF